MSKSTRCSGRSKMALGKVTTPARSTRTPTSNTNKNNHGIIKSTFGRLLLSLSLLLCFSTSTDNNGGGGILFASAAAGVAEPRQSRQDATTNPSIFVSDVKAAFVSLTTATSPLLGLGSWKDKDKLFGASLQDLLEDPQTFVEPPEENDFATDEADDDTVAKKKTSDTYFDVTSVFSSSLLEDFPLETNVYSKQSTIRSEFETLLQEAVTDLFDSKGRGINNTDGDLFVGVERAKACGNKNNKNEVLALWDHPDALVIDLCPAITLERSTMLQMDTLLYNTTLTTFSFPTPLEVAASVLVTLEYHAQLTIPKDRSRKSSLFLGPTFIAIQSDDSLDNGNFLPSIVREPVSFTMTESKLSALANFTFTYCGNGATQLMIDQDAVISRQDDDLQQEPRQAVICDDNTTVLFQEADPTLQYSLESNLLLTEADYSCSVAWCNTTGNDGGIPTRVVLTDTNVYDLSEDRTVDFLPPKIDAKIVIGVLRQIDSAMMQVKQNSLLGRNLPRTKLSFKKLLTKSGHLFKNHLVPTFLKTPPVNYRGGRSLSLLSQGSPEEEEHGVNRTDITNLELSFYFLNSTLMVFPEDPAQVHEFMKENGISCPINITLRKQDTVEALGDQLFAQIDSVDCPLKPCRRDACTSTDIDNQTQETAFSYIQMDECNIPQDECDVVVDTITPISTNSSQQLDMQLFLATVLKNNDDILNNVQLIGLYKKYLVESNQAGNVQDLLPDSIMGFPINIPDFPTLVPNFDDWDDVSDKVMQTLEAKGFSDINVAFKVSNTDGLDGNVANVAIAYREKTHLSEVSFDPSNGIGALIDVSVDNSAINVTAEAKVTSHFKVRMGSQVSEPIRMLAKPKGCAANSTCSLQPISLLLRYQKAGSDPETSTLALDGGLFNSTEDLLNQMTAAFSAAINKSVSNNIWAINESNLIVIEFSDDIAHAEILVKKTCMVLEDGVGEGPSPEPVFECGEKSDPQPLSVNIDYGIPIDQIVSKAKFEVDVEKIDLSSDISVNGSMTVFGSVAGFYEAAMNMDVWMRGNLSVSFGRDGRIMQASELAMATHSAHLPEVSTIVKEKYPAMEPPAHPSTTPTLEWLFEELLGREQSPVLNSSAIISPAPRNEECATELFRAYSTFEGEFTATTVSSPNATTSNLTFSGAFPEPFELDLCSKPPYRIPEIDIDFYFPGIGNVTKMRAVDVARAFLLFKDFLIGPETNDSVESCSGGLLGAEISGKQVFGYQLPVLGVTPCRAVQFLQRFVDTIELLGLTYGLLNNDDTIAAPNATLVGQANETTQFPNTGVSPNRLFSTNTTMQAVGKRLTTLLQDAFGEQNVEVDLNTTSDDFYSDLLFTISINASHSDASRLTIDLKELLQGTDMTYLFVHTLTPQFALQTESHARFDLRLGLEIDAATETIRPYFQGMTELEVTWYLDGDATFETDIGPLPGSVEANFNIGQSSFNPLTLRLSLDNALNYYIEDDSVTAGDTILRPGFVRRSVSNLVDDLKLSFDGLLTAGLEMELLNLPFPASATINATITNLTAFISNSSEGIQLNHSTTAPPTMQRLSLFDLLLLNPQNIVNQLNDAMTSVEDAALGRRGVVTTFPVPFIRNGIGAALGGNSKNNVLGRARRLVAQGLTAALGATQSDSDTFIDLIADTMGTALRDANGLMRPEDSVSFQCFMSNPNEGLSNHINSSCTIGEASSVVWTIPLGNSLDVSIPLDFKLDPRLPFHVRLGGGGDNAVLSVAWSFDFSFGFDESEGFFLFTGSPDEFKLEALLSVENVNLDASLLFMNAETQDLNLVFGAGFFIDIDKAGMLRNLKGKQISGSSDRVTVGDIGKIVSPSDLFHIEALAGATFSTGNVTIKMNADILGGSLEQAAKWIPGLELSVASQFRKSFSNAATSSRHLRQQRRRLNGQGDPQFAALGQLHALHGVTEHRAMGLLRSLSVMKDEDSEGYRVERSNRYLMNTTESTPGKELLVDGFSFPACPVDLRIENACIRISNVNLRADQMQSAVTSITKNFVTPEKTGILDEIVGPFLPLNMPIPGLSKLLKQDLTVLDIAETLVDAQGGNSQKTKSGVQSVRKTIKMYKALRKLMDDFLDAETIELAKTCDVLNGFQCQGGLSGCPDCDDDELDSSTSVSRAISARKKKKKKPKRPKIDGLDFPFLNDPLSLLRLIQGEDIQLVKFEPPELFFFFELELKVVVWNAPLIIGFLEFGFEATVKTGFVLDTKGIREAIEQKAPEKALNSLALMDTFEGVDEPLLTLEGRVGVSAEVNFGLSVRVGGGLSLKATIDLYDPSPETSGGLVRPYEVFSGPNATPLDWLEATLSIYVDARLTIKLAFITLFKFKHKVKILGPFEFKPPRLAPCMEKDLSTGVLRLNDNYVNFNCTSLAGTGGQEEIECKCEKNGDTIFQTFDNIKQLTSGLNSRRRLAQDSTNAETFLLQGLYSNSRIYGEVGEFILDYSSSGSAIFPDRSIAISESEVLLGEFMLRFENMTSTGQIKLPQPEMALLMTTVGQQCQNHWVLHGHSDLEIQVNELRNGCGITAYGGNSTDAKLVVDFGSDKTECFDGNRIRLSEGSDGLINITIARQDKDALETFFILIGPSYKNIEIKMTKCQDVFALEETHPSLKSLSLELFGGDDKLLIGGKNGLDYVNGDLLLSGGGGQDAMSIDDAGSSSIRNGTLTAASLLNMTENEFIYEEFETINVSLSNSGNTFQVSSTALNSETRVFGGSSNDAIQVHATQGDVELFGGPASDEFYIWGLAGNTSCTIHGEAGADKLYINGTYAYGLENEPAEKTYNATVQNGTASASTNDTEAVLTNYLDGSTIHWSGGHGDDEIHLQFTSIGTMTMDIFDDLDGVNALFIDCPDYAACVILSRENFLSNTPASNLLTPNASTIPTERINIDRREDPEEDSGFKATAKISSIVLRLNNGGNQVYFDDTFSAMDVIGGPQGDQYTFGQLYESIPGANPQNETALLPPPDTIKAIPTTRGFLSAGNSHPVSVYGRFGDNTFNFHRNKAIVVVHGDGDSGNNTFVVRSTLVAIEAKFSNSTIPVEADLEIQPADFTVNSLVHLVGGTATDHLFVVGTNDTDKYVVTKDEIRGSGLSVKHTDVNIVEVHGQAGDDQITVLSTTSLSETRIFGGDGDNNFVFTPRVVEPVVSKNLRGHRGILEHDVDSDDSDYSQTLTEGMAVEIADNDGYYGYFVVEDNGVHIISEDGTGGFVFKLCPTRRLEGEVVIDAASQVDADGNRYLLLNGKTSVLPLRFKGMDCSDVAVKYNAESLPLQNTAINLLITMDVNGALTKDSRFLKTQQQMNPVSVILIPGTSNNNAMSVTVVESSMETTVIEGPEGNNATSYDIYLRPCTEEMMNNTVLAIEPDCPGQILLDTVGQNNTLADGNITGNDWLGPQEDCKVTINIVAVDDFAKEGIHFVRLSHRVTDVNGTELSLLDDSILLAREVMVKIYDRNMANLITRHPLGFLSASELDTKTVASSFRAKQPRLFEDEYQLRLSKPPDSDVFVTVKSTNTSSDYISNSTSLLEDRDSSVRSHVALYTGNKTANYTRKATDDIPTDISDNLVLVFTPENWFEWQTVQVFAQDDDVAEGVNFFTFPTQFSPPSGKAGKGGKGGKSGKSYNSRSSRSSRGNGYCDYLSKLRRQSGESRTLEVASSVTGARPDLYPRRKKGARSQRRSDISQHYPAVYGKRHLRNPSQSSKMRGLSKKERKDETRRVNDLIRDVPISPRGSPGRKKTDARFLDVDEEATGDFPETSDFSDLGSDETTFPLDEEETWGDFFYNWTSVLDGNFSQNASAIDELEHGKKPKQDNLEDNPLFGGEVTASENGAGSDVPEVGEALLAPAGALYFG